MDRIFPEWSPRKKMNGDDLISVLYVDDDPALLAAGKSFLGSRPGLYVMSASCADDALAILNTYDFDVILSDYQMPGTDGIGFLKILQKTGSLIPFILFTGNGCEDVVIEAINNGATGYIQKGGSPRARFAELEHKIREASRRRRAEIALHETELQFQTLFECAGTAIMMLEDDLTISRVNAEFSRMTGYSREDVGGIMRLADIIEISQRAILLERYHHLRLQQAPPLCRFETGIITKNRQVRKVSTTLAIIPTTGRSIVSLAATGISSPSGEPVGETGEEIGTISNVA